MSQPTPKTKPSGRSGKRLARRRRRVAIAELGPRELTPQRLLALVLVVIGFTVVLSGDAFRVGLNWRLGQTANRSVIADRTVTWVDQAATDQLQNAARQAVPKQYTPTNPEAEAVQQLDLLFGRLDLLAATGQASDQAVAEPFSPGEPAPLSGPQLRRLLDLGENSRAGLRRAIYEVLLDTYRSQEIHDDASLETDLKVANERASKQLTESVPDPADRAIAEHLVGLLLSPNRQFDLAATTRARDASAADVEPVRRTINRGEHVITPGAVLDEADLAKLQALGLVQARQNYRGLLSMAALVALLTLLTVLYIRAERYDIYMDLGKLGLLAVLLMGAIAFFRLALVLRADAFGLGHSAVFAGTCMGILISVLVDYRLSMTMTGVLALFLGAMMPGAGLAVAFETWFSGRVSAMALRTVRSRRDLGRAALVSALGGMAIAVVVDLPTDVSAAAVGPKSVGIDALSGFAWASLAFLVSQGLLPILERLFSVVTPFRLLELANISSPALDLLRRGARGTFDSGITIGDMAAEACDAIQADSLMAQVAGYHHDLGKVRHPTWFIENQFGAENIHDRLEPTVSAMAIKSHVAEGLQLADEYNLPQPLKDAIAQHHGTTLISYFYKQAVDRAGDGTKVREEQFRYDGPRPQSKECGVIMLADGVEAAVRAAAGHGPMTDRRISEIVHRIIDQRITEGQLDECPLTRRDLTTIAASFQEYLRGMYHGRIDYPASKPVPNGPRSTDPKTGSGSTAEPNPPRPVDDDGS